MMKWPFFLVCILSIFSEEPILIFKHGTLHRFTPYDKETDHFVKEIFQTWEEPTFKVFEKVQDPEGIAIDLGAWIGTTAIWLADHFKHLVAVEADPVSLKCLENNLNASNAKNVTICKRPISNTKRPMIFGPRGSVFGEWTELNQSTSTLKNEKTNPNDYEVVPITLKELIFETILQNPDLQNVPISFIKCDIEGGEEAILEDLLHFAFHNHTKIHLSFHYSWWSKQNIRDFSELFTFFTNDVGEEDLAGYIEKNPFASVLLEPKTTEKQFTKPNLSSVIISYNQPSFIEEMVRQLEPYTKDIIVIDNNSSSETLLYYFDTSYPYTLLKLKENLGPTVHTDPNIQKLLGEVYILTDPDIRFNSKIPSDFISTLYEVSTYFEAQKVGFALRITGDDLRDVFFENEKNFWKKPINYLPNLTLPIYRADVDTTFCLINQKFPESIQDGLWNHVRIAGDFTADHIPWIRGFDQSLYEGEFDLYKETTLHSYHYDNKN